MMMFCVSGVLGSQRDLDVSALLEAYIIAMFVDSRIFDAQIAIALVGHVHNNICLLRLAGPRG
jgi:hypothetical protein